MMQNAKWPVPGTSVPQSRNPFSRLLGRFTLTLLRWRIEGEFPDHPKLVLIAAPHTSNWDFVIGIAAKLAVGLSASWLGKHTIFKRPFGPFFRWMGGIPVDRSSQHGVVEQIVDFFQNSEKLVLGLSPEGTRKRIEPWKTGFYYIALAAKVPIFPVAFDYGKRAVSLGPVIQPSGDLEKDMQAIRSFYSAAMAKFPQNFAIGI